MYGESITKNSIFLNLCWVSGFLVVVVAAFLLFAGAKSSTTNVYKNIVNPLLMVFHMSLVRGISTASKTTKVRLVSDASDLLELPIYYVDPER